MESVLLFVLKDPIGEALAEGEIQFKTPLNSEKFH